MYITDEVTNALVDSLAKSVTIRLVPVPGSSTCEVVHAGAARSYERRGTERMVELTYRDDRTTIGVVSLNDVPRLLVLGGTIAAGAAVDRPGMRA